MDSKQTMQFAFFSANLHQYLPEIPWSAHAHYFQQYKQHHRPKAIPTNSRRGCTLTGDLPERPGLITTFHLGDHAQLPIALVDVGMCFDIVIDQPTYERNKEAFRIATRRVVERGGEAIRFLFSADRQLFFKIRDSLRRGRHVLIFIDGNKGAQTPAPTEDLTPVPFFSGRLWVKRGAAVLSRLLGVPIHPLTTHPDAELQVLNFHPPLFGDPSRAKESDSERILGHLYRLLELEISDQPMRWECWTYLHQIGMLRMDQQPRDFIERPVLGPALDAEYMERIQVNGEEFWLDRKNYHLFRSS